MIGQIGFLNIFKLWECLQYGGWWHASRVLSILDIFHIFLQRYLYLFCSSIILLLNFISNYEIGIDKQTLTDAH